MYIFYFLLYIHLFNIIIVTGDNQKTRKDSQELITAPGGNASKLKLSFSVNRENKPSQPIVQESKFTAQDVNERLKDYFSKINSSSNSYYHNN